MYVPTPQRCESAEITRLARVAGSSPDRAADAVNALWRRAAEQGTPLVEELPGDSDHRAVTFLWRGDPGTSRVLLCANRIGDRDDRAQSLFEQVPGTDVWTLTYLLRADHRCSYQIAADDGEVEGLSPDDLQTELTSLAASAVPDPHAAQSIALRWSPTPSSVFALPDAPAEPWEGRPPGPHGTVDSVMWGDAGTSVAPRAVHRYRSVGPEPQPVLLLSDGDMWFEQLDLADVLDRMVAAGVLAPLTVLAPSAIDSATRWHDLAGNRHYIDRFVHDLPRLAADLGPVDPSQVVVAGQSLGGLTALLAAAYHPRRVSAVIAHSPSLWWNPSAGPGFRRAEVDERPWAASEFTRDAAASTSFRLAVGLHEGTMMSLAQSLSDSLTMLGADPALTAFNGGHDFACWRVQLLSDLAELLPLGPAQTTA